MKKRQSGLGEGLDHGYSSYLLFAVVEIGVSSGVYLLSSNYCINWLNLEMIGTVEPIE